VPLVKLDGVNAYQYTALVARHSTLLRQKQQKWIILVGSWSAVCVVCLRVEMAGLTVSQPR
jgi:hypothetical protein